jgi:predicted nuclease of restriction endonuclease-like RecB superfamily
VLHYLTERDHPWLRALLDEYERGVGSKRNALVARLREPLAAPAPKSKQRLAVEVLEGLVEASVTAKVPPPEARWHLFTTAARARAPRDQLLEAIAKQLGTDSEGLEEALFADLKSERVATPLPPEVTPQHVATEANRLLVSRWLSRAQNVRISAWGNTRALIRQARLHGLICNVRSAATPTRIALPATLDVLNEPEAPGVELEVSGPLSLFRHTLLYGRALCGLLPRVAWCTRFELRATCESAPGTAPVTLTVRTGDPIKPGRELRPFDSKLEQRFARDFCKIARNWNVVREPRPVDSGGSLIFPDFELVHRRDPSKKFLLEIVGFWTPKYLDDKLRKLRDARLDSIILCIDETRGCSDAALPKGAKLIPFRRRIDAKLVLSILEASFSDRP